jgi:hypothetical protein
VLPDTWIAHVRPDGEVVGWIVPEGEGFLVRDRLGRVVGEPMDWLGAEETLDALGIGFLAERWVLVEPDGAERPVRIAEVTPEAVTVVADEFGAASAIGGEVDRIRLPFPAPPTLRPAGP